MTCARVVLATRALAVVSALPVLSALSVSSPARAEDTPFMRSRAIDGVTSFETATRFYRRPDGTGPTVALVGVVHIGDANYYESLVKLLDSFDVVLYESVLPRGAFGTGGNTDLERQRSTQDAMLFLRSLAERFFRAEGRAPANREELRAFVVGRDTRLARPVDLALIDGWGRSVVYQSMAPESYTFLSLGADGNAGGVGTALDLELGPLPREQSESAGDPSSSAESKANRPDEKRDLYKELADALGVTLQVRSINYDRRGWEPADLPMEELLDRLWKRGERSMTLEMLSSDSGFQQGAVRFLLSMVSNSPGFKKLVIRALGEGGRRSSDALGAVDTRIIIDERNDAVIDTLHTLLAQSSQPASVAIFYGAAHMRDFEDTLRADFGLEPDGVRWDSAMSVDEWNAKRVRERLDQFRAVRQVILENDPNGSGPEVTRIDGRVEALESRLSPRAKE
jgi:hypothetical protein